MSVYDYLSPGDHEENEGMVDPWEWVNGKGDIKRVTGKYLFFADDRELLLAIAKDEVRAGFPLAKVIQEEYKAGDEYVLCLYYYDDSKKYELADKYEDIPFIKYRYWKSDEDTKKGVYSQEYLDKK